MWFESMAGACDFDIRVKSHLGIATITRSHFTNVYAGSILIDGIMTMDPEDERWVSE